MVSGRCDGLGLANSTSRRPLRSRPPLGRVSFLLGRAGKRVICGNLQKNGARRFAAVTLADGFGEREGGKEGGREGVREGERDPDVPGRPPDSWRLGAHEPDLK